MSYGKLRQDEELVTLSGDLESDSSYLSDEIIDYHDGSIRSLWSQGWNATKRFGKSVFRRILGFSSDETSYSQLPDSNDNDNDSDKLSEAITEEANASYLNGLFYVWYNSTVKLGMQRPLVLSDLPKLLPQHDPSTASSKFETYWQAEVSNSERLVKNPSLTWALYYCYRWEYFAAFVPRLIKVIGSFVGPWAIKMIVAFIETPSNQQPQNGKDSNSFYNSIWWALLLLIILFVNAVGTSVALQRYWHITIGTSLHIKSGITTLIYKKLLRLSAKSKQSNIAGKLTNLMSADVGRLQDTISYLHFLWATPLMMIICFVSVVMILGIWPTIGGYTVLFILAPLSGFIAVKLDRIRTRCVALTDQRVKTTNEIFNTMKIVKVYALEEHFSVIAQEARRAELKEIRFFQLWKALHNSVNYGVVPLMSMVTFWIYTLQGKPLLSSTAFAVIAMYYVLKWPFSLLTTVISNIVECRVSIQRIEEFMSLEEIPGHLSDEGMMVGQIKVENGSYTWDKSGGEPPVLKNINFETQAGELTCIVGLVGAGKTSLLNVLLGEIEQLTGKTSLKGKVCYAPQTPFLLHATVRDNITFGKPFDQEKYNKTVEVCALQTDFDMLIAGDMTTIGERGINLSGGQKARIAMARAVYSDSDIYLLDDPLSAVDAHVGYKLFNDCIKTMLKNKTVILVTHQLQFVTHGDKLVIMQDGMITNQGSPQYLKSIGVDLEALLEKFNEMDQNDRKDAIMQNQQNAKPKDDQEVDDSSINDQDNMLQDVSDMKNLIGEVSTLKASSGQLRRSAAKSTDKIVISDESNVKEIDAEALKANADQKEERGYGSIGIKVYAFYFGQKKLWWIIALLMIILYRAVDVFLKFWIANWSSGPKTNVPAPSAPSTNSSILSASSSTSSIIYNTNYYSPLFSSIHTDSLATGSSFASDFGETLNFFASNVVSTLSSTFESQEAAASKSLDKGTKTFLLVYIFGNFFLALLMMAKETLVLMTTNVTGEVVYMAMFMRLLRAPMSFFDTTPKGRIAARCSSDTDAMDNQLGGLLSGVWDNLAQILSSLVSIALSVHWFVLGMIPMILGYMNLYNRFIGAYRELARLQGISKAPLFSQFSETLNGLYTLRAYNTQERFIKDLHNNIDLNQRGYFYGFVAARWLGVRMDVLGGILISSVAALAIFNRNTINPGLMGMALSYCLLNTELLNGLIRGIADVESKMNSVERIEQYTTIEVERPPIIESCRPPASWPDQGRIEFDKVSLRYRPGLPYVLNGLSFVINPGEKIGVVGRTGAGKSSLLTALLGLAPLSGGRVIIDGYDIEDIGVDDLRSKLSIIPQDPTIFEGNIRRNIDPFEKYSDNEIWSALKSVHLDKVIEEMPFKLDSELAEDGANFSLGQRQLLCVARAMLKRSKILLLDEASSSIDLETDYLLQQTLKKEFSNCTTITIAHRLPTIMDSDKILVLDAGQVREFDSPQNLLSNPNSMFYALHQQAQSSSSAMH